MNVSGIDDRYLDYAHRHELTSGFSHEDDIPDPYTHGEAPQRERAVPSARSQPRPHSSKRAPSDDHPRTLPDTRRRGGNMA
ncbi:hypothetical protein [Alloactinosynnema sp. L-07]|nr:hypothetical protein [Alloactinosynnema sp. L-07]